MFGRKKKDDQESVDATIAAVQTGEEPQAQTTYKAEKPTLNVSETEREEAIAFAKKYTEDLISFFGLNTEVYATIDEDVIELHVPSTRLNGFLIGQRGDTMRSLQFMVSSALKNSGHQLSRVNVDIADYKKQRADRLVERAKEWLESVKKTKEPMPLVPMNAADRRVIHKLASENGLVTESVGEGRDRHIVLKPTDKH